MKGKFYKDPDYIKICNGLDDGKRMITLSVNDIEHLKLICALALQNSPKAIGIDGFEFMMMAGLVNVLPKYSLNRTETSEYIKKCSERKGKITAKCKKEDEYETAVAVHDMLARNVEYRDDGKLSHSMVAPLVMKYGVCDGYAKAYKYIMDGMGIPCLVVAGEAQDPVSMKLEKHAWNMIQVKGKWCHVDVTFDTGVRSNECPRYDYFGLSDEAVLIDHIYDKAYYPSAIGNEMEYYRCHGNFIVNKRQLMAYLKGNIGKHNIVVKFGDNIPESELVGRATSALNEVLRDFGSSYSYSYSYNLKQKVIQISF